MSEYYPIAFPKVAKEAKEWAKQPKKALNKKPMDKELQTKLKQFVLNMLYRSSNLHNHAGNQVYIYQEEIKREQDYKEMEKWLINHFKKQ